MKLALVTTLTTATAVAAFGPSLRPFGTLTAARSRSSSTKLYYDSSRDPPHEPQHNAWQVLATTEAWISQTLADAESKATGSNPYTRKEVSYACETFGDSAMIVAGIFGRLKEARELGEAHGATEQERAANEGEAYEPHTLRQTQVIVIPGNEDLKNNFAVFDSLIESINEARRNARDYVTDVSLEKLDDRMDDEESQLDWSVSVNCAHLHPNFGEKTPQEALQELKQEEEEGEVDVNYQEYKEKRLLARRSPFPSIVIEVRASPPPDFGASPPPSATATTESDEDKVSAEDIQKLEALFGQSAASKGPDEDAFYDAIGDFITDLSSMTPLKLAQQWVAQHDVDIHPSSAFTETDTAQVDAAYEFVFTNMQMMLESNTMRQYLVMPHFLSTAATSFEKFCTQVAKILDVLPDLRDKIQVSTLHPEHVDPSKRSPMPMFVLQQTKKA